MTTISITPDQAAARAVALAINAIDALAAAAIPVHRAGQHAGRLCKPVLRRAIAQIDWHEALRITVLGLVITAVAAYRFCRWAGPALIQTSAALGRWYAGLLVDHETPCPDPQPLLDLPAPIETPVTPEPAPLEAAATTEPMPTTNATPRTTRKSRRRSRRQSATTA